MAKNNVREFVEVMETELARKDECSAYDYITENYMDFSKSELKDIIKELLYALHCAEQRHDIMRIDYETILGDAAEELRYSYHWEWED